MPVIGFSRASVRLQPRCCIATSASTHLPSAHTHVTNKPGEPCRYCPTAVASGDRAPRCAQSQPSALLLLLPLLLLLLLLQLLAVLELPPDLPTKPLVLSPVQDLASRPTVVRVPTAGHSTTRAFAVRPEPAHHTPARHFDVLETSATGSKSVESDQVAHRWQMKQDWGQRGSFPSTGVRGSSCCHPDTILEPPWENGSTRICLIFDFAMTDAIAL